MRVKVLYSRKLGIECSPIEWQEVMEQVPLFRCEIANMAAHGADISVCGDFVLMTRSDGIRAWYYQDQYGLISEKNYDRLYPRVDPDTEGATRRRQVDGEVVARMPEIKTDAELVFGEEE